MYLQKVYIHFMLRLISSVYYELLLVLNAACGCGRSGRHQWYNVVQCIWIIEITYDSIYSSNYDHIIYFLSHSNYYLPLLSYCQLNSAYLYHYPKV